MGVRDGHQRRGQIDKPAYTRVMAGRNRRYERAFSERVVALVRQPHPGDLAG
jgi:hypothetical protein